MRLHTRKPLWPFVGILLSLLVFSLAAPRAWRGKPRPERDESALAADVTIGPRLITERRGIVVTHVPSAMLPRRTGPKRESLPEPAVTEATFGPTFPVSPSSEALSDPVASEPVFAIALPNDEGEEDLEGQNELIAPAEMLTETSWNIDLPPLDIDRIQQKLFESGRQVFESGREVARSTSRSVASAIRRAELARQAWPALNSATALPAEEPSTEPPQNGSGDGLPPEPPSGHAVVIGDAREPSSEVDRVPAEPNDQQESNEWREPKPLRLTDPSDRLAMRIAQGGETGDPNGAVREPLDAATEQPDEPDEESGQLKGAVFAQPSSLIEGLTQLVDDSYSAVWAKRVLKSLKSLESARVEDPVTADLIESVAASTDAGRRLALAAPTTSLQLHLHRLHFAMVRRIALYRAVVAVHRDRSTESEESAARLRLAAAVAELRTMTDNSPHGSAWRQYLMLDELATATNGKIEMGDAQRLELLRRLLGRIVSEDLTESQKTFVRTAPITRLKQAILHWVDGPVDIARLLRRVERYEQTGSPAMGRAIEADRLSLEWSNDKGSRQLAGVVARHFRNANLRVAVSDDFLNRLIPQPIDVSEPVNGYIAGAAVAGRSITLTKISVDLVPDPESLKIRLEARGTVGSNTSSTSGPATFRTAGNTDYVAKKLYVISRDGIHSQPAVADATANKRLRGFRTRFDDIPLFSSIARSIAIKEHDKVHFRALAEMQDQVASKARQRLDKESAERVAKAEERVREKILAPLESLALHPETVDFRTTEQRMIVRMRLVGDGQMAAHTPRPRAPSDSELSVQFHESALNNTAAQLELDGKTFTLPELHKSIYRSFGREDVPVPDDLPAFAQVTFAKHDAIRIRCQDGRLRITLSVAKAHHRRTTYRNFKVHAVYGPRLDRLQMQLARDGVLSIEGPRLRPGSHIALQGVFVKLFSMNRPMTLIPADRNDDPRMKGLMVTQCVLEDGWMSVAVGLQHKKRVAQLKR